MTGYKRQMSQGVTHEDPNPDIRALATVGMRIRKAVAEGYSVPSNVLNNSFLRVPLPSNLTKPPGLTSSGSTFDSGSNLAEWNEKLSTPLQTIDVPSTGNKRKLDEMALSDVNLNQYQEKYGALKFNEEF
ncbi:uncharacterized protein PRCAT00002721001 [Priceomyces carsonii]|uniref:uncharacterized protein n=1 Tax=Priceomyces carsonii TaxID=28549 RepID=UPI002EDAA004|nr:unnamed protein product [Priceomyces carsonii]